MRILRRFIAWLRERLTGAPITGAPITGALKLDERVFMDGHPRLAGTVGWTDGTYAWVSLDQGGEVRFSVDRFSRRSKRADD